MNPKFGAVIVCALAGLAAAQCGSTAKASGCGDKATAEATIQTVAFTEMNANNRTIVDIAAGNENFSTLVAAVKAAGLVDTLSGKGPFTVFAPTNEAFAKLPKGTVESLLKPENRGKLQAILTYHVVAGNQPASSVVNATNFTTVNGQRVNVTVDANGVKVAGASVVATDVKASNGVIHVIDRVILPSDKNIVETAQSAGSFGTLLAAAKAAGLVDALTAKGPITVLAPSDDAFAKLPAGTVQSLLRPENREQLKQVLLYHVIDGRVYADDAIKAGRAATLQGGTIAARIDGGRLMINGAGVVANDIEASNGVIHVIDRVLIPGN